MKRIYHGIQLIDSKREGIYKGSFTQDSCLSSKVLEICDILLESIVESTIFLLKGFLNKFSEVGTSSGFDAKGIEGGSNVLGKLVKGLLLGVNGCIRHLVIPHFKEINALTFIHLVQGGHDVDLTGGV